MQPAVMPSTKEEKTMTSQPRNFDQAAATWDEKPQRVQLAHEVAAAILREVPISASMNALDFGCGTGLLTLQLQPYVRTIIGADSSQGMLDILNAKIAAAELNNICSMHIQAERQGNLQGKYHLIVSCMTLHHIREIEPLFVQFYNAMVPGGVLCLADLDTEGGRFHEDNTGVFHHGFDRFAIQNQLGAAGFQDMRALTASEIVKFGPDGTPQRFSVFLVLAQRN
jgi:predicted TPR repeat methyltransferase